LLTKHDQIHIVATAETVIVAFDEMDLVAVPIQQSVDLLIAGVNPNIIRLMATSGAYCLLVWRYRKRSQEL
jgi:hypothetical protein